tara:strand:+ start:826 stop:1500 length:675 start_codon:yes stop_codon:yes gene_type:complete
MPLQGSNQTNWFHKDYDYLKVKPEGMSDLKKNWSQVWQDIFALVVNDAKIDGTFLEIGGAQPFVGNNTWLLESAYNWRGLSIELDHNLCNQWIGYRPNTRMYEANALEFDFVKAVDELELPHHMDYLSFDLEPPQVTLDVLRKFPFDKLSFNCVTYEHDAYRQWGDIFGHREIFKKNDYDLVGENIKNGACTMEEWYIHNSVDENLRNTLRTGGCEAWELLLDL